jgi:hypothetical protein
MEIKFQLDERSLKQLGYLQRWHSHWLEHLHDDLATALAEAARDYYKPFMKAKRTNVPGTGETAASVRYMINRKSDGFDIEYTGDLSALYMDTGNFPASEELRAPKGGVKKAFPVNKRSGVDVFFSTYIHGMGHYTPGVPTSASEKTVDWLEADKATALALKSMGDWLDAVVIGA